MPSWLNFSSPYRHFTIGMNICRVFHVHWLDLIRKTVPGKTDNKIFLERCPFTISTNVHSHLSAMSGLSHLYSASFLHCQVCCLPRPHNWDILTYDSMRKLEMLRVMKRMLERMISNIMIIFRLSRYFVTTARLVVNLRALWVSFHYPHSWKISAILFKSWMFLRTTI